MTKLIIVGGGRMAATHAKAFSAIAGIDLVGVVEIDPGRRGAFADEHGIEHRFAALEAALAWGQFDAAANVTPDAMHYETTMKLIAAGKDVFCEKPLATEYSRAREMTEAAEKAGIINMVNLTFRSFPTLYKAREIVLSGAIGAVRHFEAACLQSWLVGKHWGDWRTEGWLLWRLSTAHGSKGVVGDLGIHILDFATFMAGSDIAALAPMMKTFPKAPGDQIGPYKLDANDSFITVAELQNGALGVIEATRFATGYANEVRAAVHCDKGAVLIEAGANGNHLKLCADADIDTNSWREVECPPVPSTFERFATAVATRVNGEPDFARAATIQRSLDLILEAGAAGAGTVRVA